MLDVPTIDVSSKEFYGEGYDDSDKRIPDMTIIKKQLGEFEGEHASNFLYNMHMCTHSLACTDANRHSHTHIHANSLLKEGAKSPTLYTYIKTFLYTKKQALTHAH